MKTGDEICIERVGNGWVVTMKEYRSGYSSDTETYVFDELDSLIFFIRGRNREIDYPMAAGELK